MAEDSEDTGRLTIAWTTKTERDVFSQKMSLCQAHYSTVNWMESISMRFDWEASSIPELQHIRFPLRIDRHFDNVATYLNYKTITISFLYSILSPYFLPFCPFPSRFFSIVYLFAYTHFSGYHLMSSSTIVLPLSFSRLRLCPPFYFVFCFSFTLLLSSVRFTMIRFWFISLTHLLFWVRHNFCVWNQMDIFRIAVVRTICERDHVTWWWTN